MADLSIGRKAIVVTSGKKPTEIPWDAIRQWRVAGVARFNRGSNEPIVASSCISIGWTEGHDAPPNWLHIGNRALGEDGFRALARALHRRVPQVGPKDFDSSPHTTSSKVKAAVPAKKPKERRKRAAEDIGVWPAFDRVAAPKVELTRHFVSLDARPPRNPRKLPAATHKAITALTRRGQRLEKQKKLAAAWAAYGEAFAIVPEPRINWEATPWLLTVAADVAFRARQFPRALGMLNNAVNCTAPDVNPFVNLRIGQCLFELGDQKQAANYLTLAYMAEGRSIFRDENPKYFRLLEKVLKPPVGRKRL